MDPLEQARETNRRLNRRVGEAEASSNSLVSHAQREANEALLRAGAAQVRLEGALKLWNTASIRANSDEALIGRLILALVAVSLWAIAVSIYLVVNR